MILNEQRESLGRRKIEILTLGGTSLFSNCCFNFIVIFRCVDEMDVNTGSGDTQSDRTKQ